MFNLYKNKMAWMLKNHQTHPNTHTSRITGTTLRLERGVEDHYLAPSQFDKWEKRPRSSAFPGNFRQDGLYVLLILPGEAALHFEQRHHVLLAEGSKGRKEAGKVSGHGTDPILVPVLSSSENFGSLFWNKQESYFWRCEDRLTFRWPPSRQFQFFPTGNTLDRNINTTILLLLPFSIDDFFRTQKIRYKSSRVLFFFHLDFIWPDLLSFFWVIFSLNTET